MRLPTTLRLLGTAAVLAASCASTANAAQTLKLDLANPANLDPAGVAAQSNEALVAGQDYVVTVSGTGSIWAPDVPTPVTCGLPERAAVVEPTLGQPAAPANVDAALLFSAPQGVWLGDGGNACATTGPAVKLPMRGGLRLGGAKGMTSVSPIGGDPLVPRADHTYAYAITGDGTPLRAQYSDMWVADNSGFLTLVVRSTAECAASKCAPVPTPTPAPPVATPVPTRVGIQAKCTSTTAVSVQVSVPPTLGATKARYALNGKVRATDTGDLVYAAGSRTALRAHSFTGVPAGPVRIRVTMTPAKGKATSISLRIPGCASRSQKPTKASAT